MSTSSLDTRCPHCGTETGIEREGRPSLPGGLRPHEFEVLVRNEWRRRLGPEAYGRAHMRRLVATLAELAKYAAKPEATAELTDDVNQMIADLCAAGKGRVAIQREGAILLWAMRSVLMESGVASRTASRFVSRAGAALDAALDPVTR